MIVAKQKQVKHERGRKKKRKTLGRECLQKKTRMTLRLHINCLAVLTAAASHQNLHSEHNPTRVTHVWMVVWVGVNGS